MLVKPPIEDLLPHVENRYTLAIAVGKRVRQLVDGALPFQEQENDSLITLACEELAHGDVFVVPADVKPVIPMREIEEPVYDLPADNDGEELNEQRAPKVEMDYSTPALTDAEHEQHEVRSVIRYMDENDVFLMPEEEDPEAGITYRAADYDDDDDDEGLDAPPVRVSRSSKEEEELEDLEDLERLVDDVTYREGKAYKDDEDIDLDFFEE